jgi:hypothetical protein
MKHPLLILFFAINIFATPIADISYAAKGIRQRLREGEKILNHRDAPGTCTWRKSIDFPGSIQVGYLSEFIQKVDWWHYFPAKQLLVEQPGVGTYNAFISVVAKRDVSAIMADIPKTANVKLRNPRNMNYEAQWFDRQTNEYIKAEYRSDDGLMIFEQKSGGMWY